MNILDIVLILIFFICVVHSVVRGFVEELTSLSWVIIGLLMAFSFYKDGATFVRTKILADVKYIPEIIAFIVLLFIAYIVIRILGSMLKTIVSGIGLEGIDKILGLVLGIIKGFAVVCFIIFVIRVQPVTDGQKILQNSVIAGYLSPGIESVQQRVG
jgi:membrane protein required for colicin V production